MTKNKVELILLLVVSLVIGNIQIPIQAESETTKIIFHSELLEQANDGRVGRLRVTNETTKDSIEIEVTSKRTTIELKEGSYIIEELQVPDGVVPMEKPVRFILPFIKDNEGVVKEFIWELKYEESKYTVEVLKVDENNQPLQGADFSIFRNKNGSWVELQPYVEMITPKNGKLELKGLTLGKYKLVENKPPKGYIVKDKELVFSIKGDGNDVLEYKVINTKKAVPPYKPDNPEEPGDGRNPPDGSGITEEPGKTPAPRGNNNEGKGGKDTDKDRDGDKGEGKGKDEPDELPIRPGSNLGGTDGKDNPNEGSGTMPGDTSRPTPSNKPKTSDITPNLVLPAIGLAVFMGLFLIAGYRRKEDEERSGTDVSN